MKTKRLITAAEWRHICSVRGVNATGYPFHDMGARCYYWSWGLQPDSPVLAAIAKRTPAAAAKAFLALYRKRCDSLSSSVKPVRLSR